MSASSCTVGLPQMKDYVLTEYLGTGTYATVYKAVHKVYGVTVCVGVFMHANDCRESRREWLL